MPTTSILSRISFHDKVDGHLIIPQPVFFIKTAADFFEEEEGEVQQLVQVVENVFITGIQHHRQLHTENADVYALAKSFANIKVGDSMAENFENGYLLIKGGGAVTEIFGSKLGTVINHIAATAGVKASTAYTYSCLYATVVLQSLGRQINEVHMDEAAFVRYLDTGSLVLPQTAWMKIFDGKGTDWTAQVGRKPELMEVNEGNMQAGQWHFWKSLVPVFLMGLLLISVYLIHKHKNVDYKTALPANAQQAKAVEVTKF